MEIYDGGYENAANSESSTEISLFANMQLNGDFNTQLDGLDHSKMGSTQKLDLPGVSIDYGSDTASENTIFEIEFGSPMEVAQAEIPAGAQPLNYDEQALSLRSIPLCDQGTADSPFQLRTGDDRGVLFFTEADGDKVAVQKQVRLISDTGLDVPNRKAELVMKRFEFHQLAEGVTARVEMTPPADELRYDHRIVSPEDDYQLYVIDENNQKAYKYTANPKSLEDGSALVKDLDNLKNFYSLDRNPTQDAEENNQNDGFKGVEQKFDFVAPPAFEAVAIRDNVFGDAENPEDNLFTETSEIPDYEEERDFTYEHMEKEVESRENLSEQEKETLWTIEKSILDADSESLLNVLAENDSLTLNKLMNEARQDFELVGTSLEWAPSIPDLQGNMQLGELTISRRPPNGYDHTPAFKVNSDGTNPRAVEVVSETVMEVPVTGQQMVIPNVRPLPNVKADDVLKSISDGTIRQRYVQSHIG